MKRAFLVTSSIALDPNKPFKGTSTRTIFSTDERLEQTIFTINNLHQIDPDADILFLDSSAQKFGDLNVLRNQIQNLTYIQLEQMNPAIAEVVRTHPNKSHCECLMMLEFFKFWKKKLREYDFITKICGRYIIYNDTYDPKVFQPNLTDKFFFKKPMMWDERFYGHMKDAYPEEMIASGLLGGHYTVTHAFGKDRLDHYETLMALCCQYTDEGQKMYGLDVEYALYYFMELLGFNKDVLNVPWVVLGRCGVTGKEYTY